MNHNSDVLYLASLKGMGVNSANNVGVWLNTGSTNTSIALKGEDGALGPGLGNDTVFTSNFRLVTAHGADNAVAFGNTANGPATNGVNKPGLWRYSNATNMAFALAGETGVLGPGLGGAEKFSQFNDLGTNEHGETVYYGTLEDQAWGVWRNRDGANSPVALTGRTDALGPDLGPGISFVDFPRLVSPTPPLITGNGLALFQGILSTNNRRGLWLNSGGHNTPIAVAGESGELGPGLGSTVTFTEFDSRTVMNSLGHVAFQAELSGPGPIIPSDNHGLWTYVNGRLELIARSGQQFDVDSGSGTDLRTVYFVEINTGYLGPSGSASLNDSGDLVFRMGFTDGTYGVFVAHLVPEPKSVFILLCAMSAFLCAMRHHVARVHGGSNGTSAGRHWRLASAEQSPLESPHRGQHALAAAGQGQHLHSSK